MNRVAGIRTDPGLSNSQLADDPILERSAAHQPPWDPRMRACICVYECMSVCVCVCVYRHVDSTDVRISVHICRHAVVQTNVCFCVYMYVFIRKEGRAIRNQTEAVCALCPLFEGGL